jgi:hypothetical protein
MSYRLTLLCILAFVLQGLKPKKSNYFDYHKTINTAQYLFLTNRIDSSFQLYKQVFSDFEFIFPRDCLDAAQFSYYANRKDDALRFLKRGFENGITPYHIQSLPLFEQSFKVHDSFYIQLMQDYKPLRSIFLNKINIKVLLEVSKIYWIDQSSKNSVSFDTKVNGATYLDSFIESNINRISAIMKDVGFPGEKIIGIGGSDLYKELKLKDKDLYTLYNESKHIKRVYEEQFNQFSTLKFVTSEYALIPLYHHPCPVSTLGNDNLISSIKSGNLHPRDYGFLIERNFHQGMCKYTFENLPENEKLKICPNPLPHLNGFAIQCPIANSLDSVLINKARYSIGICPLEVDSLKLEFQRKSKAVLFYGIMNMK